MIAAFMLPWVTLWMVLPKSLRLQLVDNHGLHRFPLHDCPCRHSKFSKTNDADLVKELNDVPGRIQLEPFLREISIVGTLVVIILKKLTHHEEIEGKRVLAMVIIVVIGITIFMTAPVDQGAVDGAHKKMDGQ